MRWGVDLLAWIAPIAWLHALRLACELEPRRRRPALAAWSATWILSWIAVVATLVTAPIPAAVALGFGIPIALLHSLPYLGWACLQIAGREGPVSPWWFASAAVVTEWIGYDLTELGTWGAMANAATSDLPLLQIAALAGPTAIGFVVHALAAASERHLFGRAASGRTLAVAAGLFVAAHAYGGVRLAALDAAETPLVQVAAVATDSDIGGWPLPDPAEVEQWNQALFARTRAAAEAGAELVVWTEGATLVLPEHEPAWLERLAELARSEGITLVAAYVVPLAATPPRYENALVLLTPTGELAQRYLKHHPVPGEPAVAGTEPIAAWTSPSLGRVAGAICYDYDFPRLARAHAEVGADLVALPSSDWRGIDPIHTHMARLRAIENGASLIRSTRWGMSAGIDAGGRVRGWHSAFEPGAELLLVALPRHRRATLYAWAGEWFVVLCGAFVLIVVGGSLLGRRR